MRVLKVKTDNGWEMVFCIRDGKIITTKDRLKALPQKALWAESDLVWFQAHFANHEFKLE